MIATTITIVVIGYFIKANNLITSSGLAVALLIILAGFYLIYKQLARQQASYRMAEIELGEDYIVQRQKHKPDIHIQRDEVTGLLLVGKGLTVQTSNIFHSISVSADLIGYEEVKSKLASWAPVQSVSKRYYYKHLATILIPSIGIIVSVLLVLVTQSLWPLTLAVAFYLGRIVFFMWFNWQRLDLTAGHKRTKLIGYGVQFFFIVFLLIYALLKVAGTI